MPKRFKHKKKFNYKSVFVLLIFVMIIYTIFKFTLALNANLNKKSLFKKTFKNRNIINSISNKINEEFNNPTNIVKKELNNYKIDKLEEKVAKQTFDYVKNDDVLVYIYNSHQGEKYAYDYLENYNIVPDVKMVAHMIEDNLAKQNIKVAVEDSDILAYMKEKGYNHAQSYIASRIYLEEAIKKYPTARLFIDLHRDAATHSVTYTKIDGKECAKVLFVVGLENENYQKNLELTTKINNTINTKYPTLSRGIMKKQGPGVNGVYNQDVSDKVILLEVGGNENNIDELINTTNLISNVIGEYLNEKEEK